MSKIPHPCSRRLRSRLLPILTTGIAIASSPGLHAATETWNVLTGFGSWSLDTSWLDSTAPFGGNPTLDLVFNAGVADFYEANNDIFSFQLNTLTLNSLSTAPITISGNLLEFRTDDTAATISQSGTGEFIINSSLVLTDAVNFAGAANAPATSAVTINGQISGGGVANFNGGYWRLTNASNGFFGAMTINTGAFVNLAPTSGAVNFAPGGAAIAGSGVLTINGGTLELTTANNGNIALGAARPVIFGFDGGTLDITNANAGNPGAQGGNIASGDLVFTLNNAAGNAAVVKWNGGQLGLSTNIANSGDWQIGTNTLRFTANVGTGAGPLRIELTNGAMMRGNNGAGTGDNTFSNPMVIRGVLNGDPTSGPSGTVATGVSLTTGRMQTDASRITYAGGVTFEGAMQINNANRTTALNGNITIASNGYIAFQGRGTGTNINGTIQAPGSTTNPGHNVLYVGENAGSTLTIQGGGIAVFDGRLRIDQNNAHGVVMGANATLDAGGNLRIQQSISNYSGFTGLTNFVTNQNAGDIILRGNITGQGTTASESVLTVALPAPNASGSIASGVPLPLGGTAPGAGTRPFAGLVAEAAHNLIINGTGFGGLRVDAVSRPDRLFAVGQVVGGAATPDPTPNATKLSAYLTAARLAALSGSGGYLTPAAAGGIFPFPNGGEWSTAVPVGLRIVDSNTGGVDVSLAALASNSFSHNIVVGPGATLDTGTNNFTFGPAFAAAGLGLVTGTGTISGSGGIFIGSGATLSPGFGVGTITVGDITIGGTLEIETTTTPTSDLLSVAGNLTLGPTSVLMLPVGNIYNSQDYTIATYTGTLFGTFGTSSGVPAGYEVNYATPGLIKLHFTSVLTRIWDGIVNGNWDTTTGNWRGTSNYSNSEQVLFDDTAAGPNFIVTITGGDVMPGTVTVNNATKAYTIVSSPGAALTGTATLVKSGDGLLTLSGPASYTGGTLISGGELRLGASNSLPDVGVVSVGVGATLNTQGNSDNVANLIVNGTVSGAGTITTGALTLGSGASFAPSLVLNGNLTKNGAAATTLANTVDLGGNTRTFDVGIGAAPELVVNGTISNGTLTKTGGGTLVLGGVNALTGTTNANGGTLRVGVAGAVPTTILATGAGGTLDLNGIVPSIGTLNNSGTTLTGGVALTVGALNGATSGVLDLAGAQLTIDGGGGGSYAGAIVGFGTSVIKQSAGVAILTGGSSYTGGLSILGGRVNASGGAGGSGGINVNSNILQMVGNLFGDVTVNGGTVSSGADTTGTITGNFNIGGPSAIHLYSEDNNAATGDFLMSGILRGTGNLTVSASNSVANPDGADGLRFIGGNSDYTGTIFLGPRVKLELRSNTSGNFSPIGLGKIVAPAGTTTGARNGTYAQVQTRTDGASVNTTYGNNVEITGSGVVNFNVLGGANSVATMGDLRIGGGQSIFFNKNDNVATRTLAFTTVTLTGGDATFSVMDPSFGSEAVGVGPNVQLGAIGEIALGSGAIFKAAAAQHITITGASTYTGVTDIQNGILSVSLSGSLASSSEIRLSSGLSKFDFLAVGTYEIPATQKLSGTGDWDGRIVLNGTLAPGVGTGAITGDDLAFNTAGIMQFELSTFDNSSDRLFVSNFFEKGLGDSFRFDFEGGGALGQTYTLVQFGVTNFVAQDFSYFDLGPGLAGTFFVDANTLQFSVVPEPASVSGLVGGLALLAGMRRRRML